MLALYIGDQGCGKSTLLRKHVYDADQDVRCFLIMDRDRLGLWPGTIATVSGFGARSLPLPRFLVFQRDRGIDVARLAIGLGDCIFVDEECHRTIAEHPWRSSSHPAGGHPLYDIVHEGRHLDNAINQTSFVGAWCATHRANNVPRDARSLANRVYLGRAKSYAEAETIYREGWLGGEIRSPLDARRELEGRPDGFFSVYPQGV